MKKFLVVLAALAALGIVSTPALAKTFPIKHVTFSNLAKACAKAGGTTYSGSGGSYGCAAGCKGSGNNNTCSVECTGGGQCTGTTPGRTAPGDSVLHVLGNAVGLSASKDSPPSKSGGLFGDGILGGGAGFHGQGPAATGSPASAPAAPVVAPKAPPLVLR